MTSTGLGCTVVVVVLIAVVEEGLTRVGSATQQPAGVVGNFCGGEVDFSLHRVSRGQHWRRGTLVLSAGEVNSTRTTFLATALKNRDSEDKTDQAEHQPMRAHKRIHKR